MSRDTNVDTRKNMGNFSEVINNICSFKDVPEQRCEYQIWLEKTAKVMISAAEGEVNRFGYRAEEIAKNAAESRENLALLKHIVVSWISFYGTKGSLHFDARNAVAVERCKDLYESNGFNGLVEKIGLSKTEKDLAEKFAERSLQMHRTLMQSFTAVIMCLYNIFTGESVSSRFPLI